jgi:uncharacterized protein YlxP (DUF503 family)
MVVGAALIELHVHGSQSLKQKRGVIKSIIQRVRNRFNVSVAEVGGQDTWQRAVLGLSVSSNDSVTARRVLERAVAFVEDLHLAEVRASDIEILQLPYDDAAGPDGLGEEEGTVTSGEVLPWGQE